MKNLTWNVFRYDFNSEKIEVFNVIKDDLIDDIKKGKKKHQINSQKDLKEIIRSNLMWHYWSKAEHEYVITDLWGTEEHKKDVWFQIEMNLDRLTEYLWQNLIEPRRN